MQSIRFRLLGVGNILLLITLACNFSLSDTGFVEPIAQEETAEAEWQSFVATQDERCADLTVEECDELYNELGAPTLGATEQALATARVEATATRAYFETQEALCTNLTPEECANAGSHPYTGTVTANLDLCGIPAVQPVEQWDFSFEAGGVDFNKFSRSSIEGYSAHTRIAENTYEFIYQDGLTTHRIIFSQNGFVEETIFDAGCVVTHTYTFSE